LLALSTGLRAWAGLRVPTPWIVPDEVVYAEIGRSLWSGDYAILGEPAPFYGVVYQALAGLPLSLGDLELGYDLLKVLQAAVMSLAAVPVYLWGRSFLRAGWALAAAALTLAAPGLMYSGLVMTEVAFYPIMVLAAWLTARALARPTLVTQALVVGVVALAVATRLQAFVLGPAILTAGLVGATLAGRPRLALRLAPATGGLVVLGAVWAGWRLLDGGPASELFGAYRAAAESGYDAGASLRWILYHAADAVLFTGVLPACAIAVLFARAASGRERSRELAAFLAVAVSFSVWLVVQVGIFASAHVGRLAERDLLPLAPIAFLGLAAWLDRGAPRSRLALGAAAACALALVAALPVAELVSRLALPDAFTLAPLYRLELRAGSLDLDLVVLAAAAAAVAAAALVPRRLAWTLALGLGVVLVAVSVSASRVVAGESELARQASVGDEPRWIDERADAPVTLLYSSDFDWTGVWRAVFWNHRIARVYSLLDSEVPGPLPQRAVGPYDDGRIAYQAGGLPFGAPLVAAPVAIALAGDEVGEAPGLLRLWRPSPPLRLAEWVQGIGASGWLPKRARVVVFACAGGQLRLTMVAPEARRIDLRRNDADHETLELGAGETRSTEIPAAVDPPAGQRSCTFDIAPDGPVFVPDILFTRAG
jgi:hypothetical protein